ncbi:hypothetical protein [Phaffia rhodozyma]|uniref:VanZ-like domain-containing protein n=1 Tax=Phaffia rhodozyma TaxID=264483 RepID=A0A0F7SEA7_PHARH|nr:hypothetical protein [Phaffia rhodozyma]
MMVNIPGFLTRSIALDSIWLVRTLVPPGVNLRIRLAFFIISGLFIGLLAGLALAPLPPLGLDDKIQHFLGNAIATTLVYPILDPPPAPRLMTCVPAVYTLLINGLFLGILSEFVQDWTTNSTRSFDWQDILANLSGLALALPFSMRYWSNRSSTGIPGPRPIEDEERVILLNTVA